MENLKFSNDKKVYVNFFKNFLKDINEQIQALKINFDEQKIEEMIKKYGEKDSKKIQK
jgi:hypothetical protein